MLIGLEMAGVLGLALAWGGYELWSLRKWREREKREREQAAQGDAPQASDSDKPQGR